MNQSSSHHTGWNKVVLGVDPGSKNAGYAIIKAEEKKFRILDSGVCKMSTKLGYFERLSYLHTFFTELTENIKSFDLAIEALAFVKNANSFGKLAQARGAILASLEPRAYSISEYPPNLVKSTVSGYGHASKQNIEKSLGFSVKNKDFRTHDESDALAVALCHHFLQGNVTSNIKKRGSRTLKSAFKGWQE